MWLLLAEGHLNRRRFGAMLGRIACYRYGRDRELVAKAAAESVYSGVGKGEVLQKRARIWGNFGLCWCPWQADGSAPVENHSTKSRISETGVLWCRFRDQKGNSGERKTSSA
jgi:hypothetical protein